MKNSSIKQLLLLGIVFAVCLFVFFYIQFYTEAGDAPEEAVTVSFGDEFTVRDMAETLEGREVIRDAEMFLLYLRLKKMDRNVLMGTFDLTPPFTVKRVAEALVTQSKVEEVSYTIIPGWTIRDVAAAFVKNGLAESEEQVYELLGQPAAYGKPALNVDAYLVDVPLAEKKPENVSWEGYLRPDTFRFYPIDDLRSVLVRFVAERDKEFTEQMYQDIEAAGRTVHEVITLASIVEREVRGEEDRRMVADLFWRRYDVGMALQADSTVHYLTGKKGDVFTAAADRDIDSPWNTYKYPGLPPGSISTPSKESIMAVIYPKANEYWYFLTTLDTGEVKYGQTLDEHNRNVREYLR